MTSWSAGYTTSYKLNNEIDVTFYLIWNFIILNVTQLIILRNARPATNNYNTWS